MPYQEPTGWHVTVAAKPTEPGLYASTLTQGFETPRALVQWLRAAVRDDEVILRLWTSGADGRNAFTPDHEVYRRNHETGRGPLWGRRHDRYTPGHWTGD